MAQDREACLAAGMDDHLGKPFSRRTLQAMLERWMPERVNLLRRAAPERRFLQVDRAPAVHGEDLPGHVRRAGEEMHRARDVLRRAGAPSGVEATMRRRSSSENCPSLGPGNRAGRDAVHPYLGRELERERARERLRGRPWRRW